MYLYHGSPRLVDILQPFQAFDWMNQAGNFDGVYATDLKDIGLAFCLGGKRDKNGNLSRTIEYLETSKARMVFLEGTPNMGEKGYLYILRKDDFKKVSKHQYVSKKPVIPVKVEEVRVDELEYLFRYGSEEEIEKARKARES